MIDRTAIHDTFTMERSYNVPPARVYVAWTDPAIKANWFPKAEKFDFRVGGEEVIHGGPEGGPIYHSVATYLEIVPNQRILYSFTIDRDKTRISVSIMTVEFKSEVDGTRLVYTEQCVFLDGQDTLEEHMHGMTELLNNLDRVMARSI